MNSGTMGRPPSAWQASTWRIAGGAALIALSWLMMVLASDEPEDVAGTLVWLAGVVLLLVLTLGMLVAYPLWVRDAKRLVRRYGASTNAVMPAWVLYGWLVVVLAGYLSVFGLSPTRNDALTAGLNVAAMALQIACVLSIRFRIMRLARTHALAPDAPRG